MLIPGIPDKHLELVHTNVKPGKGGELALKHIPSGITVGGALPPKAKVHQHYKQLLAELAEKLAATAR